MQWLHERLTPREYYKPFETVALQSSKVLSKKPINDPDQQVS